jgi:two-component system chemotaxis response regulator CheY
MDLKSLSVLVVDDNSNMRKILGAILKSFGIRDIREADDGLQALRILNVREVDIIFTDLMMQPVDGLAFIKWIRTSTASPCPYAPIVMITGHATKRSLDEARMAGVTEFLAKPLTARGVMHRLNEVISNPRPFVRVGEYFGPCRRRRIDHEFAGEERRGAADEADTGAYFDPEDVY